MGQASAYPCQKLHQKQLEEQKLRVIDAYDRQQEAGKIQRSQAAEDRRQCRYIERLCNRRRSGVDLGTLPHIASGNYCLNTPQ